MLLGHYLGLLHRSEGELAKAYREVGSQHRDEADVAVLCERFAKQCDAHVDALAPFARRYGEEAGDEPERLHSTLFAGSRTGPLALLRDLHDLYLLVTECDVCWVLVGQAAQGARDNGLGDVVGRCDHEIASQLRWVRTRLKDAAPQSLVVS
jgi:hypothetical protein